MRSVNCLIACIVLLMFPSSVTAGRTEKRNPLLIGAILPLSGDYAQYGQELQRGLLLAQAEIGPELAGLKVIIEDGATMTTKGGINAANKLIHSDGVEFILVLGADDVAPIYGMASAAGVPIVSLWDSSPALSAMGDYVFSNGFSVEITGAKIANHFLKKLGLSKVAVIGNSTTWSISITEAFRNEIIKLGGAVVFSESVADDWADFRTMIVRLKKTDAQAVFLPLSLPSATVSCIRQLQELGVSLPVATGEAFVGDAMNQLGKSAEGVIVGWPPLAKDNSLIDLYRARFGSDPWNHSIYMVGYDGLKAVVEAITQGSDKDPVTALRDFYGLTRRADREYALFRVREGRLTEE